MTKQVNQWVQLLTRSWANPQQVSITESITHSAPQIALP